MILYCKKNNLLNDLQSRLVQVGLQARSVSDESGLYEWLEKENDAVLLFDTALMMGDIKGALVPLKEAFPTARVFALSLKPSFSEGTTLLRYGVKGYANIYLSAPVLGGAIEEIKNGKVWLYPEFVQEMIRRLTRTEKLAMQDNTLDELSPKEKEVAHLVAQGLSNKEIGEELHVSETTIKSHLSSIYAKLDVKDRLALALLVQK